MGYGTELILDLHGCDPQTFTRRSISKYFRQVCTIIEAEPAKLVYWDYKGCPEEFETAPPHLKGTTAVQFITKSNITIHTLDDLTTVFLNIFSCGDFKTKNVADLSRQWFRATDMLVHPILKRN